MSGTRAVSKHVPRYHYALLLISPNNEIPIDRPTLLQLLQKELGDWFGTTGGVNSNEVGVLSVQSTAVETEESNDRRVVLRFPRSVAPQLLTALPLLSSPNYRIQVSNKSSDPSRLTGFAGQGKMGYEAWKTSHLVTEV